MNQEQRARLFALHKDAMSYAGRAEKEIDERVSEATAIRAGIFAALAIERRLHWLGEVIIETTDDVIDQTGTLRRVGEVIADAIDPDRAT